MCMQSVLAFVAANVFSTGALARFEAPVQGRWKAPDTRMAPVTIVANTPLPMLKAMQPKAIPANSSTRAPCIPQVRQSRPRSCPLCGMALERVLATVGEGTRPELRCMTRRLWTAAH